MTRAAPCTYHGKIEPTAAEDAEPAIAHPTVTEVLVVDDDRAVLHTIADALEAEGYAVVTAHNGAVALERLRHRRPDVVLLDLMMPVMDGWTFLALCRAAPGGADLPVVVLSALSPTSISISLVEAFITKPFDLGELLATVERLAASGR